MKHVGSPPAKPVLLPQHQLAHQLTVV